MTNFCTFSYDVSCQGKRKTAANNATANFAHENGLPVNDSGRPCLCNILLNLFAYPNSSINLPQSQCCARMLLAGPPTKGGGLMLILLNLLLSIVASIVAHYICKWLDERQDSRD